MSPQRQTGTIAPEPSGKKRTNRERVLSILHATLGLLDAEIVQRNALHWVIGGPLVRLERATLQADSCVGVLTPKERAQLRAVLDAYGRIFEAVARTHRARTPRGADEGAVMTAEVRREVESARGALQTLFETFAHGDVWASG